jgi:hypothetical protein
MKLIIQEVFPRLQILGERHDEILHEVNVHAVDVSNKTQDMTSRLLLLLTLHPAIFRQHKHVPDVRRLPL